MSDPEKKALVLTKDDPEIAEAVQKILDEDQRFFQRRTFIEKQISDLFNDHEDRRDRHWESLEELLAKKGYFSPEQAHNQSLVIDHGVIFHRPGEQKQARPSVLQVGLLVPLRPRKGEYGNS